MLFVFTSALVSCADGTDNALFESSSSNNTVPAQDAAAWNKSDAVTGNSNAITPVSFTSNTALNPAHGAPGHRCDIPVGQPLNSKPGTLSSNARVAKPASTFRVPLILPALNTTTLPAITNTTTIQPASGLNPKHGMPGHRCDIPVGQPLNSKPASTATSTTAVTSSTNTATVATGLNPKHGMPGHRCDIAVGQPLNSKPPQATATTTSNSTSTPSSATTPATNTTTAAPLLNPKHGELGHRCDIATSKHGGPETHY